SHDLAGAAAEGTRRVRGRIEEDAVFLAAAIRRQTRSRPQPSRDGKIPGRHAPVLSEQDAALQLTARSRRHRTNVTGGVAGGSANPYITAACPWEDGMWRLSARPVAPAVPLWLLLAAAAAGQGAEQKTATFAGGCFWCVEADFDKVEGVVSTTSGYTGGGKANPSYEEVSRGGTGHAEAVEIVYDPSKVSYQKLLDVFWHNIDPLVKDRQFCDHGNQYRTAIFYHGDEQRKLAEASKAAVQGRFKEPIATEIVAAGPFYKAEDYHQDFYVKNPIRYKFYRYNCGRDTRLEELWGRKE